MRPHPRVRKTIKWTGAAMAALLIVVWVWSGWFSVTYIVGRKTPWWTVKHGSVVRQDWTADVSGATTGLVWGHEREEADIMGEPIPFQIAWLPARGRVFGMDITVVPLWPLIFATAGAATVAWRLDTLARRRARLHHCVHCNYDRTGLTASASCPECGSQPA